MPLTPQDVHSKVFGPTRFRRGYDESEVDAFLDEVEAELTRLHREIDSLRSQLAGSAGSESGSDDEVPLAEPVPAHAQVVDAQPEGSTAGAAQAAAQSVSREAGTGNLEQQVARTLVLAQRAADEAVRDAEEQAAALRSSAEGEAERIRAEAERQAEQERQEIERSRHAAEDDLEQLRSFEKEYRTRLRAYLELQLQELDSGGSRIESRRAAALPGGGGAGLGAGATEVPDTTGVSDTPGGSDGQAAPAHTTGGDDGGLLTSRLPSTDPGAVPPMASAGGAAGGAPTVPPSVPVDEYRPSVGITGQSPGDEEQREARDLGDRL